MQALDISDAPAFTFKVTAPSPSSHTITRHDRSVFDAKGLYSSLGAYAFGGRAPVACGGEQRLMLPRGNVTFTDASCNLHTINIGTEPYSVVIAVVGGEELPLRSASAAAGAMALGALPLPAKAAVARLTLSRDAGGQTLLLEPFELCAKSVVMPAIPEVLANELARKPSATGSIDGLFGSDDSSCGDEPHGIRRIPSKERMGG